MLTTVVRDEERKYLRLACADTQDHTRDVAEIRAAHPGWVVELHWFERRAKRRARGEIVRGEASSLDLEVVITRWEADGTMTTWSEWQ